MNKVAFITGAAKGIGREIALTLAEDGFDIALNYRSNNPDLETLEKEIKAKNVDCFLVQGDVSDFDGAEQMVKSVIDKYGRIDVLVNNAGITKDGLLLRMDKEDFNKVIEINLIGTFNMSKAVASYMIKQKSGRIISLSSVVGISGNAGQCNYAASKAGIIGFTKSLAKELGGRNILVNAIAPGYIQTSMTEVLKDEIKDEIAKNIPLKRLGEPKDVAKLVKFLAGDDSSYITGQVIHVDGGMLM